jgi:hypothetical protein
VEIREGECSLAVFDRGTVGLKAALAAVCSQVRNASDAGKAIVGLRPSKFAGAKALSCFGLYGTTKVVP